jgi:hypothetical protein
MTPNEAMIVSSCVAQVKASHEVCKQLLELVQLQVNREAGIVSMSTADYNLRISSVMKYVTPIIILMQGKE